MTNQCKHLGVIMDGNGRWAKSRGLPRAEGHRRGADNVRKIVEYSLSAGIEYITLYSFSTENWSRPKEEVDGLMTLLKRFLPKEAKSLKKQNVRLGTIGDISRFPQDVQDAIFMSVESTASCDGIVLILALNYGGRDELVRTIKKMNANNIEITEKNISQNLDTANYPDPNLIIRTAGEQRLSNFLVWQSVYTEFLFLDKTWPEFKKEDFDNVMVEYNNRVRNFGGSQDTKE